ncbi:lipopolysaccharide cholinephosphotransferase [Pseudomonas delhiensis]|uniref:Lipopolysaccharide cholinephosphotransferase n=1 Tax=Pseudomonas delhiensis TaxID=366289 RepID=A0A239JAS8_9PSED|nr:LicD family protein [Pseudomonas delhiensis]SDH96788.1 lipopolysaccharide cholinephosphotransferase [Pseudomonas delhiensis]SNT02987.1 lipopolysaccharide cholinephosphotransferase [Pseudomonas delhiensis]
MVAGVPLARIQQRAFAVLGALVDFFQAHAIDYYLVGGTLLGAVRHGGFIPWDDDIDIVVPRKDYRRLLGLLDRLPPTLRAIHPSTDAHTPYPFLVVSDRHSRWVVDYAHPFDRGIGVDVFPLDGVPPPGMRRRLLRKSIALLRSMTMNKQKGYYLRPVPPAQRWRFALVALATSLVPRALLFAMYDRVVSSLPASSDGLVGNLYGLYGDREVVPAQVFGSGKSLVFHGGSFRAPAHTETYLTHVYGDFRQLPPLERRNSGHRIRAVSLG